MAVDAKAKYFFFIPATVFFLLVLAFFLIGHSIPFWILLVCSFLMGFVLWLILEKRNAVGTSEVDASENKGIKKYIPNLGKLLKTLIYLAIVAVVLYFVSSYLMNTITTEQNKQKAGLLNSIIYSKSIDPAQGLVVNNGTRGILLSTGASTGATFIFSTINSETGWPSFGADIYLYSPKGEDGLMKVRYLDLDSPSKSIYFKEVKIPAGYPFRYSNKYKLSDYRAWIANETKQEETEKVFPPYRIDPPRHDIEFEVYVPPSSYVELSNMTVIRNW